ncbi:hypothetical protein OsccyDRAFT_0683 [Leptolyngbyaceae cyanobacterium JSC-12]|nr:hypothetical protein OsccyDRAFT_0683 [Leptolyngbyaceae cyanobacterium JSC-12]
MTRIFPTPRQLVLGTIVALASHPRIQNPGIYYIGSNTEEKIVSWRSYGGYELEEEGLVCSVYPAYSSRTTAGSAPPLGKQKSIQIEPYNLGSRMDASSLEQGTYNLIVELSYRDANLGEIVKLGYDFIQSTDGIPPLNTPHGTNVMPHEGTSLNLASEDLTAFQAEPQGLQRQFQTVEIKVSPAEELLREYTELLRLVLNDIPHIRPYTIRSSRVVTIDFPTSAWTRESEDLLFHTAYIHWELTLYPPGSWKDVYFMPVTSISATAQSEQQQILSPYYYVQLGDGTNLRIL